ncbi:MAG: alpha/beta hydrolase, partial [Pseudomonadota bacterium]
FFREFGAPDAPALLLLHGFPTHSLDWAKVVPAFPEHRVVVLDLLGYGASDKPRIAYSYQRQTDLVLSLLAALNVTEVSIVSHDYSVSIAQEMLARELEGTSHLSIRKCIFLNGGVFPELHRQQRIHKLLQTPVLGQIISHLTSPRSLCEGLTKVAGKEHPWSLEDAEAHFKGMKHKGGSAVMPRLLHYIAERQETAQRWVSAMRESERKTGFVWGPDDPVSGAHIAERLRREFPANRLITLPGVGHYPHWEAPGPTSDAIAELIA